MPLRNLTDEEFHEGYFLAKKLSRVQGESEFTDSCMALAQSKILSRGQLETLRVKVKNPSPRIERPFRGHWKTSKSKRPISLAGPKFND